MQRKSGVIHAQGQCRDCGMEFTNYKNALANGARHAQATGHEVDVEQCVAVTYNPKD